MINLIRLCNF